jgi:PKD repeat protein
LIKTIDGGASWFQISSGSGESLNDIDRFSNGNLIAVGDNGTILTSNGISPWVLREPVTTNNITAVQVMGSDSVVVVDENGQVATSPDGGATWTATGVPPSGMAEAEDIHFNTFLDGWLIGFSNGSGAMYHTVDGGLTWTAVPDFMGAYVAMDMEGSNIWAANVSGRYYRSTDNGNTWIEGDLPGSAHQIQDMDFFDESIGYAVGWWNQVFRSDDGGTTWAALQLPNSDEDFTGIYLLGANELWLSTNDDRAYYSATGGQNWAVLEIGSEGFGNFKAIAASAEGDAWVVGFQGYIEHFAGPPPPPLNLPPVASFDFTTTGLAVEFTDTSFDPDGSIVSWEWDFDDGTGSSLQNPSHTYQTADTYIVSLTVSDNDNDSSTYWRIVSVQPGPGGTFGDFTEVTPLDSLFVTPQDEDFWVITTAPADYDNDGDLDIAVLGYYVVYNVSVEEKLVLLRNDGQAGPGEWEFSYIDVPLGSLTAGSSDMAWGDLDADGDLELVLGTDGATVIYRNDAGLI